MAPFVLNPLLLWGQQVNMPSSQLLDEPVTVRCGSCGRCATLPVFRAFSSRVEWIDAHAGSIKLQHWMCFLDLLQHCYP